MLVSGRREFISVDQGPAQRRCLTPHSLPMSGSWPWWMFRTEQIREDEHRAQMGGVGCVRGRSRGGQGSLVQSCGRSSLHRSPRLPAEAKVTGGTVLASARSRIPGRQSPRSQGGTVLAGARAPVNSGG